MKIGKAVPVSEYLLIFGVLAAFCEDLFTLLVIPLKLCFTLSFAVNKLYFRFTDLSRQIFKCFNNIRKVILIFFAQFRKIAFSLIFLQ